VLNRIIVIEAALAAAVLVAAVSVSGRSTDVPQAASSLKTISISDLPPLAPPPAPRAAIVERPRRTPVRERPRAPEASQAPEPSRMLRSPKIVVEKSRGRLTLYESGKVVKVYPVITGTYRGDKVRKGDRRTPEGDFYVCVRNPVSQYTLSLGLSYPDESDARRGLKAGLITPSQYKHIRWCIRNGKQPPWNTKLGGSIMIHGEAAGRKSTAGCIAMSDEHIRELYPLIPEGTPVTVRP